MGEKAIACCMVAACVASYATAVSAAVRVELIDRGTPTGGTQPGTVPPDYRGKVVRVISDEPILSIDAASSTGPRFDQNFGFFGDLLHFEVATQPYQYRTTPLEAADNSTPGLLNFDSHFLPLPAGATYTVAPYEVTSSDFNIFRKGFPETSTEFQQMRIGKPVGMGPTVLLADGGRLSAAVAFLQVAADATGDGRVNFDDLLVLSTNFFRHAENDTDGDGIADWHDPTFDYRSFGVGDFDNDGDVDFDDLVRLSLYLNVDLTTA